jgi:hypothetical protein
MACMDGEELDLTCPCGHENFERVVVRRKPNTPIVTDFVACVGCRAVYLAPVPRPVPTERPLGSEMGAIGGPEHTPDSAWTLKRDAELAAKAYQKPGRSKKERR